MSGFAAISQANGWAMAVIGAFIVFSGLAILAGAISQLPRLLSLIERIYPSPALSTSAAALPFSNGSNRIPVPDRCPSDLMETARYYDPMVQQLGETFTLTELYRLAADYDFPHPHLTISCLRQADILAEAGDDRFRWNREPLDA